MTPRPSQVQALAPCPFCGTDEFVGLRDAEGECSSCGAGAWGYTVRCNAFGVDNGRKRGESGRNRGCGADCGFCDSAVEAIAAWNRRTPAGAAQEEPVARVRETDSGQLYVDWLPHLGAVAAGDDLYTHAAPTAPPELVERATRYLHHDCEYHPNSSMLAFDLIRDLLAALTSAAPAVGEK